MRTKPAVSILILIVALLIKPGMALATICGDAYFNNEVTWWHNSPLYFTVAGAPASTCGDLWAWRNGSGFNMEAAGWICTDANGTATKGPWYWSNQTHDELASGYIDWGSCTSPMALHIWDITPPTAAVTSSCPSSFSGTASDGNWGAGFNSNWAACQAEFYNASTQRWWNPSSGAYDSTSVIYVNCSCNGMPATDITWSCSTKPSSHVPGQSYYWYAWVWDGGFWNSTAAYCSF